MGVEVRINKLRIDKRWMVRFRVVYIMEVIIDKGWVIGKLEVVGEGGCARIWA